MLLAGHDDFVSALLQLFLQLQGNLQIQNILWLLSCDALGARADLRFLLGSTRTDRLLLGVTFELMSRINADNISLLGWGTSCRVGICLGLRLGRSCCTGRGDESNHQG
ncbi:hypothetical protein D3C80_1654750 [compost metagenome]